MLPEGAIPVKCGDELFLCSISFSLGIRLNVRFIGSRF